MYRAGVLEYDHACHGWLNACQSFSAGNMCNWIWNSFYANLPRGIAYIRLFTSLNLAISRKKNSYFKVHTNNVRTTEQTQKIIIIMIFEWKKWSTLSLNVNPKSGCFTCYHFYIAVNLYWMKRKFSCLKCNEIKYKISKCGFCCCFTTRVCQCRTFALIYVWSFAISQMAEVCVIERTVRNKIKFN